MSGRCGSLRRPRGGPGHCGRRPSCLPRGGRFPLRAARSPPATPAACSARCAPSATSGASAAAPPRRPDLRSRPPAAEATPLRRCARKAAHRVRRLLPPLRAAAREPRRPDIALHVADGSQILARTAGAEPEVLVGPGGREPFGSCLSSLAARRRSPRATCRSSRRGTGRRRPRTGRSPSRCAGSAPAPDQLRQRHGERRQERRRRAPRPLDQARRPVAQGSRGPRSASRPARPRPSMSPGSPAAAPRRHRRGHIRGRARPARRVLDARLGEAVKYDVPEQVVMNAQRSLLVQDLALTWRYSVGNPYEEFSSAGEPRRGRGDGRVRLHGRRRGRSCARRSRGASTRTRTGGWVS